MRVRFGPRRVPRGWASRLDRDSASSFEARTAGLGQASLIQPPAEELGSPLRVLKFVARVYGKHGQFDQTAPQSLWMVPEEGRGAASLWFASVAKRFLSETIVVSEASVGLAVETARVRASKPLNLGTDRAEPCAAQLRRTGVEPARPA